ncbi:LPS export ABC transporter periplasmic protein LptC [Salinispirillum sp. LH 10-3-1]|uniref:LPS export ABC transporter periplasmic protein LptC n=1 Tax=Salinispirillum sp. LH 10-3-1 TaxID=2952525 RepID=A0AB38YCS4_9GAMM
MNVKRIGLTLIVVLATVAGLWLSTRQGVTVADEPTTSDARTLPQLRMANIERITTDTEGVWVSTLLATHAEFYDKADRLVLENPDLQAAGNPPSAMTANRAEVNNGRYWTMTGNVVVISDPEAELPLVIRTSVLHYDNLTELATTDAPVTITQGSRMNTEAIGMTINLNTLEFDLHEQVRSIYRPD